MVGQDNKYLVVRNKLNFPLNLSKRSKLKSFLTDDSFDSSFSNDGPKNDAIETFLKSMLFFVLESLSLFILQQIYFM